MSEKVPYLEHDSVLVNSDIGNEYMQWDVFAVALSGKKSEAFLINIFKMVYSLHGPNIATVSKCMRVRLAASLQPHQSLLSIRRSKHSSKRCTRFVVAYFAQQSNCDESKLGRSRSQQLLVVMAEVLCHGHCRCAAHYVVSSKHYNTLPRTKSYQCAVGRHATQRSEASQAGDALIESQSHS